MWRLDARVNATKVWYPIVWEKTEDASNVIDYDIRSEQSKDISAEINANNQTTTGMANVIPWINAPKLIEDTSIYKKIKTLSVSADAWNIHIDIAPWESPKTVDITQFTLSDENWTVKFTQTVDWLKVPATWTYVFTVHAPSSWSSWTIEAKLMKWTTSINSYTCPVWQTTTFTAIVPLTVWDIIYYRFVNTFTGSWYVSANTTISMDITKL